MGFRQTLIQDGQQEVQHVATTDGGTVVRPTKYNWIALTVAALLVGLACAAFASGQVWGSATTTTPNLKTVSSAGTISTVTTSTTVKTRSDASDGLLEAMLGAAGALLLFGVAYGRITSITLPGGAVVALSALSDDEKAKVDAQTDAKTSNDSNRIKKAARQRAETAAVAAKQSKAQAAVALSDSELERITTDAASAARL